MLQDLDANEEHRQMLLGSEKIPELTEEKIQQAVKVVPGNYWQSNCWKCSDEVYSMFTCPFLQPTQLLYFAYRYYVQQIAPNPVMANYFEDRLTWR